MFKAMATGPIKMAFNNPFKKKIMKKQKIIKRPLNLLGALKRYAFNATHSTFFSQPSKAKHLLLLLYVKGHKLINSASGLSRHH